MSKSSKDLTKILSATALAGCAITTGTTAQAETVMAPVPTLGDDAGYKISASSADSSATFTYSTYDAETQTVTDAVYDISLDTKIYGETNAEYAEQVMLMTPNFDEVTVYYDRDFKGPMNATDDGGNYYYPGSSIDGDVANLKAPVTVSRPMDSISGTYYSNYADGNKYNYHQGYGGAIYNAGSIGSITADFISNTVETDTTAAKGGAIASDGWYTNNGGIGTIVGDFVNNSAISSYENAGYGVGGAICNSSPITSITGNFIGNYAYSESYLAAGGAIINDSGLDASGNPIGKAEIDEITGDFLYNTSESGTSDASGGAISNFEFSTVDKITGDFVGNLAYSGDGNAYGGAIENYGTLTEINGDFISNEALAYAENSDTYGGAIANYSEIGTINGDFVNNSVTGGYTAGGAIYNEGSIEALNGNFVGNSVEGYQATYWSGGGAIYSSGDINSIDGDFINNSSNIGKGGAIFLDEGNIGSISGNFVGNTITILDNVDSYDDIATGAAISSWKGEIGSIEGDFVNNKLETTLGEAIGGAIENYEGNINSINADFYNNTASGIYAEGGAISNSHFYYGECQSAYIGEINGNFVGNKAQAILAEGEGIEDWSVNSYGGAIHNAEKITVVNGDFIDNSALADEIASGGAIANFGYINSISGKFNGNTAQGKVLAKGGAVFNEGEFGIYNPDAGVAPADDSGASSSSSVITNDQTGFINSSFTNNSAIAENGEAKGGAIYTMSDTRIVATDSYTTLIEGNYTESAGVRDDNAIYMDNIDGTLTFELKNKGNVVLKDNIDGLTNSTLSAYPAEGYNVNITGDGTGTFYLHNDIRNADVIMGGVNLDTVNNNIHTYEFNTFALTDNVNMVADVDLRNEVMDRFSAKEYGQHSGELNVVGLNMISDMQEGKDSAEIMFAEQGLKDNVAGSVAMPSEGVQTTFYTPVYKYNATYENRDDAGYFIFARGDKLGNSGAYNPSVLGSSVASTAGAMSTMTTTFNYAFQNADNFMNIPYLERIAIRDRNKVALSPTGDATDVGTFSPLFTRQETSSAWVKPYATFESVDLSNGPKVSNITYGTLVGFDTDMKSFGKGWDGVFTGYIGYNGASQRYSGVDSYQNGGLLGGTLTLYKGNFFNATTVSTGASVVSSNNMYGHENFGMLLAGVGNKAGYNFEFKEGKVILQPSMLVSYTFVNTFDYTNAAGARIESDPLHALQLAPGVKVIGNLKNGWQPYVGVSMVWNLLDDSSATANGIKLPSMSIKPYVQYGVGVQKRMKDHFMAYGQAMVQNGGRNGVALSAGFRWAIGHDELKKEKEQKVFLPFLKNKFQKAKNQQETKQVTMSAPSSSRTENSGMLKQI
ncbi:hypothetical protein IJ472_01600 [bacterium]|nr:hypothetical protein [bacterium]